LSKKKKPILWAKLPDALPLGIADSHAHVDMISDIVDGINERNCAYDLPPIENPTFADSINAAKSVGVVTVLQCACELEEVSKISGLIAPFERVFGAVAIHPNEAALHDSVFEVGPDGLEPRVRPIHRTVSLEDACEAVFETAKANPKIISIGETGMDLFRTAEAGKSSQIKSFKAHLEIAKELNLAVQIHDRNSHREVLDILSSFGKKALPPNVVFHSFSGDKEFAEKCTKQGFYLSFSGSVTFKSSDVLREALKSIPLSRLLVETDAPYMTPHPHRSSPNAPYMTPYTVRFIASVLEMDVVDLCARLRGNFSRAFGEATAS
jgi:TatD DNase family protein